MERRGMRNALALRCTEQEFFFPNLPKAFDGYRLLHLTDPHFDLFPGLTERIVETAASIEAEICVMTGDYHARWSTPQERTINGMDRLIASIRTPGGVLAILGNHDSRALIPHMERLGIDVLDNRAVTIARGGDKIEVIGIEDRRSVVTRAGHEALATPREGFSIALVHSPRYATRAERAGAALYLCGHTHAGQVCLPGGISVYRPRGCWTRMAGRWQVGTMQGYTSAGAGVSLLPIRFNCPGEIARITLRRGEAPA
jgi:hypothetical protein